MFELFQPWILAFLLYRRTSQKARISNREQTLPLLVRQHLSWTIFISITLLMYRQWTLQVVFNSGGSINSSLQYATQLKVYVNSNYYYSFSIASYCWILVITVLLFSSTLNYQKKSYSMQGLLQQIPFHIWRVWGKRLHFRIVSRKIHKRSQVLCACRYRHY